MLPFLLFFIVLLFYYYQSNLALAERELKLLEIKEPCALNRFVHKTINIACKKLLQVLGDV